MSISSDKSSALGATTETDKSESIIRQSGYCKMDSKSKSNLHTDLSSSDYNNDEYEDHDESYNTSCTSRPLNSCDINVHSIPSNTNKYSPHETNSSRTTDIKWVVQLAVVMFAMVFNGTIYGYTSPAFTSLVRQEKGK